jgi:peptidyl-tRNA hydrolase
MKMYILIRDSIPTGHAINAATRASLACFLKFAGNSDMQRWLADSFKKVTCKVTDDELSLAMKEIVMWSCPKVLNNAI